VPPAIERLGEVHELPPRRLPDGGAVLLGSVLGRRSPLLRNRSERFYAEGPGLLEEERLVLRRERWRFADAVHDAVDVVEADLSAAGGDGDVGQPAGATPILALGASSCRW
jgi:hypothetical protein